MTIAYFSMEIGFDSRVRTYSGGLGILAGDMLKAAADLGVPMVGVTLLYRKGNFEQHLDAEGNQTETPRDWDPNQLLKPLPNRTLIALEGRQVALLAWLYEIVGVSGAKVPVYLLDAVLPENDPADQVLTESLYGGDARYRLRQEAILGLGGVAMLRSLGYDNITGYHMNEGHAALLGLALAEEISFGRSVTRGDFDDVQERCVFTTHTPVPAGHDIFPLDMVSEILGPERTGALASLAPNENNHLNLTEVAVKLSRFVNGVSLRHEQVTADMFPLRRIGSITNGVHAGTWTAPPFRDLYDARIPGWRDDSAYLRRAVELPLKDVEEAHRRAKAALAAELRRRSNVELDLERFTIGLARRAAAYKRIDLVFSDIERLLRIHKQVGPLQFVCSGKAHPKDEDGKESIRNVFRAAASLGGQILVVYIEDYDMDLASYLVSGVDLWLNTPERPMEASGTSGMKAALNGVPSFSTLDGWWVEGHVEGQTGWVIEESDHTDASTSLYDKLERVILPLFYKEPDQYSIVKRTTIALNGSYFTAQRMLDQYVRGPYNLRISEGN